MTYELWKTFKITNTRQPTKCEVSSIGRRKITNLNTQEIRILDFGTDCSDGYKLFGKFGLAHRCIAETFIPNPENKPFVNHIDGNKSNNNVSNLEWVTAPENVRHAYKSRLIDKEKLSKSKKGKNNPGYKYNLFEFIHISGIIEVCTMYDLRSKYNLDRSPVSQLCLHKIKSYKGWSINICM